MFTLKYKRTYIPTGKTWINDFNDTTLIPHCNTKDKYGFKFWIGECEQVIAQWNKMGIVDGKVLWSYELVVESL